MCTRGAGGDAGTAGAAGVGAVQDLCFPCMGFGIVTPGAAKGTALEKNGGADAVAVVGAKVLNVEDLPARAGLLPYIFSMGEADILAIVSFTLTGFHALSSNPTSLQP